MYVARHKLHLRPKRRTERWARLRGLPQAAGLARQESRIAAERALAEALEAELEAIYPEVSEWEMQLLRAGGKRLVREWVRREFAARDLWTKDEGSVRTDVAFGEAGLRDTMPRGVTLKGTVPALSSLEKHSVAHLYGSGVGEPDRLTESERLYYGLYMLALHEPGREAALEIEGTGGKRHLLVLSRGGSRPLTSKVQEGLHVTDLSTTDDPALAKRIFFEDVKRFLGQAADKIRQAEIAAQRGEHCEHCDYGELCRRHKDYGEEDSPFGADLTVTKDG
jgi:hypothetical protein